MLQGIFVKLRKARNDAKTAALFPGQIIAAKAA